MARWFHITGQRIGLSIQLQGSVQDDNSATRQKKMYGSMDAHYRNSFCHKIYENEELEVKCNKLDLVLKQRIPADQSSLSCRCHQGVSNVVIPYRYHDDPLDIRWYIYIGQFLLLPESNYFINKLAKETLRSLGILDIGTMTISADEAPFVQPGVFARATRKFEDHNISRISFIEFARFREYALTRFQSFLERVYKPEGKSEIQHASFEELRSYVGIKAEDEKVMELMDDVYHTLTTIPKLHFQLTNIAERCEALKIRFDRADPDNLRFWRSRSSRLRTLPSQFDSATKSPVAAEEFIEDTKVMIYGI